MKVTVERKSNRKQFNDRLAKINKRAVYVGIPAASASDRATQLLAMAATTQSITGKAKLMRAAKQEISNAELLFIFSKGSPIKGIPPRPVIEPAIEADGNKQPIARELAGAAKAMLDGDEDGATRHLTRAGMAGQNAARAWLTDPRNGFQPNAQSTIDAKGSDVPGIDTGAMRQALTYVLKDE